MNNDIKFLPFIKNAFNKRERDIIAGYLIKYNNDKNSLEIHTAFAIRNPKDAVNNRIARNLIKERMKVNPLIIYINSPDISFGMYSMDIDNPEDIVDTVRFEKLIKKSMDEFVQNVIANIIYSTDMNRLIKITPSMKSVIKIEKTAIYNKVEMTLPEDYKTFEKSKRKEVYEETFKQVLQDKYKVLIEESIEKMTKKIDENVQENIGEIENIEP